MKETLPSWPKCFLVSTSETLLVALALLANDNNAVEQDLFEDFKFDGVADVGRAG
jgi:hypothetical protein